MQIEISSNFDEVAARLLQFPEALQEYASEDGLLASARVVKAAVDRTTLYQDKTGNLRAGTRVTKGLRKYRPSALVTNRANHCHLIELGTVRNPAIPFMMTASLETRGEQLSAFARGVNRRLNRVQRELLGKTKVSLRTRRTLSAGQEV